MIGGEAGRQQAANELDGGQGQLTGQVEDEGIAHALAMVTRLMRRERADDMNQRR